jgi:tetratricopeptide (TPR) repeat protein
MRNRLLQDLMARHLYCRGAAHLSISMLLTAIAIVTACVGCSQHSLQYDRALKYMKAGDYDSAETELKRGIEWTPHYPELYELLVTVYVEQGEYELALDAYEKYRKESMPGHIKLEPGSSRAFRPQPDAVYGFLKANYELACKNYIQGNYKKARRYQRPVVNTIISADSEREGIARFLAEIDQVQFLFQVASTVEVLGASESSQYIRILYREILKRDPENKIAREVLQQIGEQSKSREE